MKQWKKDLAYIREVGPDEERFRQAVKDVWVYIDKLEDGYKQLLVLNLDYAITVAESDPVFLEDLRPQLKKCMRLL